MITIVWGRGGTGKSTYAVQRALMEKDRQVLCNFHSVNNRWSFASWEKMQRATDAVCIVDEAHMWFSARQWAKQSVDDLGTFMQSRKAGLDLILVVQHPNRLDCAIREVAHNFVECQRLGIVNFNRTHWEWNQKGGTWKVWIPRIELFSEFLTTEVITTRDLDHNMLRLNPKYVEIAYRCSDIIARSGLGIEGPVWTKDKEVADRLRSQGQKVQTMIKASGKWLPLPAGLVVVDPGDGIAGDGVRHVEFRVGRSRPRSSNTGSAEPKRKGTGS